jgi:hypothetical protein
MIQTILRAAYPRLYPMIQEYRFTDDTLLPWAYQRANPQGRPLHNDWQFFRDVPRIDTAYRIPLPLKGIKGTFKKVPKPIDPGYPVPPGTVIFNHEGLQSVMVEYAEEGWSEFAFWHHDHWEPCVTQYMRTINIPFVGKRVLKFYSGLKADVTYGDWMGWIEPAMSLTRPT